MKRKVLFSLIIILFSSGIMALNYPQGKVNSQFTKTWFSDGHIEAIIVYTDGTHYTYPTEWLDGDAQHHRLPHAGDPKHCEWVWNNVNGKWQWVQNVCQYY